MGLIRIRTAASLGVNAADLVATEAELQAHIAFVKAGGLDHLLSSPDDLKVTSSEAG